VKIKHLYPRQRPQVLFDTPTQPSQHSQRQQPKPHHFNPSPPHPPTHKKTGPLAQTKFVLQKALARGLAPLVVLNKVDRPAATQARCDAVTSQLFDLFAALGASDEQLDFPVLYASAKQVRALCVVVAAVGAAGYDEC